MMQAFRNAAKPVVYLITITFLSWMILDLSGITGKGGFFTRTTVGSVNGEPVDVRAYQAAVQNETTRRQQSSGGTLSLEQVDQVRNDVWDQFVESIVVNDQIKQNHISTSPDEIADWIKNVPPPEVQTVAEFQTAGHFDLSKYQRWLASPVGQQYVPNLEAQSRDQILRNKLYMAVTADVILSDAALWQKYRDLNEQAKISLTPILGKNIVPDSAVPVTNAEIESYYQAHRKDFERPRTAFMHFVAVPRALDASDSAAALARVRSVRSDITNDSLFADAAKRESADTATAKLGGDLGELNRTTAHLDPAMEKAVFSLPLNTVSEPILDGAGYHLIEVTKREGDKATVRQILIPIELAGAHRNFVDAEVDSLQRLAAEGLDPARLDTVARALKRPMGETGPVPFGSRVQLGSFVVPDAGVWAFQAKIGETSPVIDGEAASYVFRLDSLQEAGVPPLVQVHDAVAAKVREQKKEARARQIATDVLQRVQHGATLAEASKALGLPNREFDPFPRVRPPLPDPKIVGAAFGLPVGALSGILDTPDGLYIIKVLDRTAADTAKFVADKDQLRSQMIRSVRQQRITQYLASLHETAKIEDRRAELQKTNAQSEAQLAAQQGATQ